MKVLPLLLWFCAFIVSFLGEIERSNSLQLFYAPTTCTSNSVLEHTQADDAFYPVRAATPLHLRFLVRVGNK
jgi:hypothetical protein